MDESGRPSARRAAGGTGAAPQEGPNPLQRHLGYEFTAWSRGYAALRMPLQPFHMNRYGLPHGGLYATLLDSVMSYAGTYAPPGEAWPMAMTLSLTTNFLARPEGSVLLAEARLTGGGARTFFVEGTVADDLGTAVASGSGVFRVRVGRS